MDEKSAEVGSNGETVTVGEKFEFISEPPDLISKQVLSVGSVIEIVVIDRTGPQGIEIVIDSPEFKRKQNVSPTTLGECLGVVEYKNNPEKCLKRRN